MFHSSFHFALVILVFITIVFLFYVFPFPISSFIMEDTNEKNTKLFQYRKGHMKSKCEEYENELEAKYQEFSPKQTYENIVREAVVLYNSKSPFLWCRIPKVASQSWSDLFVSIW